MRWTTKISAQTRLSLIYAALILLAAWFAGSAVMNAVAFQGQLSLLQNLIVERERRTTALENFVAEQLALRNTLLEPEISDLTLAQVLRYRHTFDAYIQYEQMTTDADIAAVVSDLQDQRTAYDLEVEALIAAAQTGGSRDYLLNQISGPIEGMEWDILATIRSLEKQGALQIQFVIGDIQVLVTDIAQSGGSAMIVLGLLLVLGIATSNSLFQPLSALSHAVHQFEAGEFTPKLLERYTSRADEMGEITRSFSAMATSMIESNKTKEKFLAAASRFIPTQYLEFLEKDDITKVDLGDNVAAEMAVMFSDIRGFTSMSEKMTAQQNFDFVNDYLKQISPLIQEHDGFIVKFLGDGMMAIFPYGVEDAVLAGIAKQEMVKDFNAQTAQHGLPPISVGVGIHTGSMMVGMIGEEARLQGDAFSDNVNLTSRIEGLNKFFGTSMIISEDTLKMLPHPERFKMRFLGKAVVKGRIAPLGLYEVYQGLGEEVVACREATKANFERGLALYTQGQFRAAYEALKAVLSQDPQDKTAQYYLDNCIQYGRQTLPAGWDGVIIMDSK